jgi:hypothetical protein
MLTVVWSLVLWSGGFDSVTAAPGHDKVSIIAPLEASLLETLAAREVRRYVYLRTGELIPIIGTAAVPESGDAVIVAEKGRPIVNALSGDAELKKSIRALQAQQYIVRTIENNGRRVVLIIGGDPLGTLYGAYRFVEHLGVRFYLHGDEIPDGRIALVLPMLNETGKPLFELRGIQPFHDFPEGPDWWNLDDYKAIVSQLPKLRMNFIGLHTYPEGGPNAEPTVWIGLREDIGEGTQVKYSYPSSYQNTLRGNWGYAAKKTSDFVLGASELFDRDAYGADVMKDLCPQPKSPEASGEMFQRVGDLLREAFEHAHRLGVKVCVGTETPLRVPTLVQDRLRKMGKDPAALSTIQELYEGVFARAAQTYPLDFYWFWTPENWTSQDVSEQVVQATVNDMQTAIAAAKKVNSPFQLATCGWVLGPQNDRALFDNVLPKDMPLSCINRQVGKEPVDPGFERVKGRPKWAIPWLEDDPSLTVPQLWAGRMRMDAADALRYGCTGLMGIHWRTRVLGPNVLALAWAAWDQSAWKTAGREASGPLGGQVAAFPNNRISDTQDEALYQTVRYDMSAYRLIVPNGIYTVTLEFCEPHYSAKGKRSFDVKIQGKKAIDNLDIFAKVGQNKALDYTFDNIAVRDGILNIEFPHRIEYPCIAAIVAQSKEFTLKINCGGAAYKDYIADPPAAARNMPTNDFYRDWALCQFGPEAADAMARVFEKIDGNFPCPATWMDGPGGLKPDPQPWDTVQKQYAFVDELAALRPQIRGAGNLERFDYWLNTFRYTRATGHVNCVWAEFNKAMAKVKGEKDANARKRLAKDVALPLRKELVRLAGEAYQNLLATVSNPDEMGTVANWEQHIMPGLLTRPGQELAQMLGEGLPDDAQPAKTYRGPVRLIVPTVRSSAVAGEVLTLKVLILTATPVREAALYWRPMGAGEFNKAPLVHVSRGVYSVRFPPEGASEADLEYYVRVRADGDDAVFFPATAPAVNQTVVVMPAK